MATPFPTNRPALRWQLRFANDEDLMFGSSFYTAYTGGPPDNPTLNNLAGDLIAPFTAHLQGQMTPQFALKEVRCYDLLNPSSPYGFISDTVLGSRSDESVTDGVSAHLFYDINRNYRGARPGSFWPFGGTSDLANRSQWSSGYISELTTAWGAFMTAVSAIVQGSVSVGLQVGISRIGPPYAFVPGTTPGRGRIEGTKLNPAVVWDVTGFHLTPTLGSQRRRLRLGG